MSKNELALSIEFTPEYFSQHNCEITPIIFTDEGMKKLLSDMRRFAESFVGDATTEKGRDEMRREAKKFSTSKVLLENFAKNLEADAKKIAGHRVEMSKRMDECRDIVKAPADEFDRKEKERVFLRAERIAQINNFYNIAINGVADVKKYMHDLKALEQFDWMEFEPKAQEIADRSGRYLADKLCEWVKREEDSKELEELKKFKADKEREENDRLQKERDEKAAAEAAEKVRIAAEKAAEEAIKKEQARVEAEKKAEEAEAAKREANKKHRAKINSEAAKEMEDMLASVLDPNKSVLFPAKKEFVEAAKFIVEAIAKGEVPHVSIKY